jgi:hypothetical protein
MSAFEYTITPRESAAGRRWEWKGGPVSFDTSGGGEILDWNDVHRGPLRYER